MEVAYVFRNLGSDTTITNPLLVAFEVRGPAGDAIRPQQFFEPVEMGDRLNVYLPNAGIVGRMVDVSCLPYRTQDPHHPCQFDFAFDEPGDYRITARHFWLKRPVETSQQPVTEIRSDSLVSNQVRVTIVP